VSGRNKGLCIGGPLDGETRASDENVFVAPERQSLPVSYSQIVAKPAPTISVRMVYYQFMPLRFGDRDRGLWTCDGMSDLEAFDALIAGYKKP
jgi:hypothetical protein